MLVCLVNWHHLHVLLQVELPEAPVGDIRRSIFSLGISYGIAIVDISWFQDAFRSCTASRVVLCLLPCKQRLALLVTRSVSTWVRAGIALNNLGPDSSVWQSSLG